MIIDQPSVHFPVAVVHGAQPTKRVLLLRPVLYDGLRSGPPDRRCENLSCVEESVECVHHEEVCVFGVVHIWINKARGSLGKCWSLLYIA